MHCRDYFNLAFFNQLGDDLTFLQNLFSCVFGVLVC